MKHDARIAVLALGLAVGWSEPALAQSNVGGIRSDQMNEKLVRELYDEFTKAWNAHDVKAMAKRWAIDGDHLEPDGTEVNGRAAIEMLLTRQHESVFRKTRLNLSIADVWFLPGDTALVDGGYEIYGIVTTDGQALPARRGHLTAVLIKEQDEWWIAASRLMIPTELPYKRDDQ